MFRPDPRSEHTVDEAITKLTEMMNELPNDSPRAKQLAETIRRLQASQSATGD